MLHDESSYGLAWPLSGPGAIRKRPRMRRRSLGRSRGPGHISTRDPFPSCHSSLPRRRTRTIEASATGQALGHPVRSAGPEPARAPLPCFPDRWFPHSLPSPRPLLPPLLAGLRGHLGRRDRSRGAPGKLSRHPGAHGCQQNSTSRRGSVLRAISGDASRALETGHGVWRSGGARSPCFSFFRVPRGGFRFLG